MIILKTNINTILSSIGGVLGIAITIDTVYSVLGIIITVLNILIILYNTGLKIRDKIKAKQYETISEDIEEAVKELNKYKEGDKHE